MSEKKTQFVIAEFLQNATPEERAEFEKLLKEREQRKGGLEKINVNRLARQMAASLQEQMGITSENVKRMTRELVVRLAREKCPDITNRELRILLNQLVPDEKSSPAASFLPPEVILSMVQHVISYAVGAMTEEEKSEFPDGWFEKYWALFPSEVKELISSFLNENIDIGLFWKEVKKIICARSED